jgi:hypothetical protein
MTAFANHQLDPAFQVSEISIFTPDICKASLAAIRFTDTMIIGWRRQWITLNPAAWNSPDHPHPLDLDCLAFAFCGKSLSICVLRESLAYIALLHWVVCVSQQTLVLLVWQENS